MEKGLLDTSTLSSEENPRALETHLVAKWSSGFGQGHFYGEATKKTDIGWDKLWRKSTFIHQVEDRLSIKEVQMKLLEKCKENAGQCNTLLAKEVNLQEIFKLF